MHIRRTLSPADTACLIAGCLMAVAAACPSRAASAGQSQSSRRPVDTVAAIDGGTIGLKLPMEALTSAGIHHSGARRSGLRQVAAATAAEATSTAPGTEAAGQAEGSGANPKALEGTWFCPKAFIMESGGLGATTLKLKGDGVYVIEVRPANRKDRHLYREYGTWTATAEQLSRTHKWWQLDGGKLEKLQGITNTHTYSLEHTGQVLILDGLQFKRAGSAATKAR